MIPTHRPKEELGITVIQRICDVCGMPRNTRSHKRCSKLRQQRWQGRAE